MTCRMAAGQQKKRLISSNLQEQYRQKKKSKIDSSDRLVNLKSHVDLKWDDSHKRVVPKREQVGISWSDLAAFIESIPKSHSGLADVIYVPRDTFSLENLSEVLSYEVWATCLTEAERKFLTQFLPSGINAEQVVHMLLTGENHHFGNCFLNWSAFLCSGNLHPDAVLHKEQQFRANKKAYHVELNNYHSDMLEVLKKWKDRWLSCEDPENPEKLFRHNPVKQKQGNLQVPSEKLISSKAPKKDVPLKIVRNGDVAKYMSYIKVSRTQHDLVKNMKHSGDGIQPKLLTRVLGEIDNFHIQPLQSLMEEEKKRLHEHWLQVSCKDLPAAFEVHRNRKLLMEQLRKSLGMELAEKAEIVDYTSEELTVEVENVDCSPQVASQGGNDESPDLQDQDLKVINYTNTSNHSHGSPDVKDQDLKDISYMNTSIESCDSPDVQDQDLKEINNADTSIHSHSSTDLQDEDLKAINYTDKSMDSHESPDEQDQDLKDMNYANTSICSHESSDEQDRDLKDMNYANTSLCSHENPDEQDQDLKDMNYINTSIHSHHSPGEQDHDLNGINETNASIYNEDSPGEQDQDLNGINETNASICNEDSPDEQDQDLKDMNYTNTAIRSHDILGEQDQDLNDINYTNESICNQDSPDEQDQDLKDINYTNTSIHSHDSPDEQDQDLKDFNYTNTSFAGHHLKNIPAVNSHLETSPVVVDQKAESITVVPTDSSSLLSKPSGEQIHVEEVMELKDPTKCEKDAWQPVGTLDSYYCPPENSMYTQSSASSLKLPHLSGGRQACVIDLERDIIGQQAQGSLTSAFHMGNEASLLHSSSNLPRNEQLQTLAKDAGMVSSYSLGHINGLKQPMDLQSMANNRLSESASFPTLFQEQKQLLDQRQYSLYVQQFVNKNLYSGVRFPNQGTFPMVEQQNFVARNTVDCSYNWFPDEHRAQNSWSGIESASSLGQCLPCSSSADGSLYSVLSQCNQVSPRMQFGTSSSNQYVEARSLAPTAGNLVPTAQNLVPTGQNLYGYPQNQLNNTSNHVASVVDASLNNMQWMSFPHNNSGIPDPMSRQFRGPWNR